MTSLNSAPFSKNTNPTIHNVFPELNQGKRYLQKQTEVEKKINNTRNFIESFTPYNKRGQLKKCRAVGQASANKHVPCACGNAMCTTSTPYCNYQLGACFSTPTNQNQAKEDWDVNSNCSGDGQFSSCKAKAGCASYGYCAPPMKINPLVQWDNDRSRARGPNGGDLQLNSLMGQQTMTKADYMSNVQQYVLMPPPCNGDLANCQANPPYYGRNVTIPQQIGPAPYGPGYPHPACGLEVLGNPGDGGTEAVSRAQVESLDAACHAEPDCVGFGQKSGGGWDFLKWNANPAYLGPTDTQMKTPGNYPKYFYIQNPVTGCNSSKCCGIQGTPGNCKTDPYDPACYVPGGAPPVPNTPTPTAAPPPPSIDGGWSGWSTSCPPAPNNIQTRTCSAPPPAYGGADCSALDGGNGYRACNPPVNGGWSDWTTGCPPAPGNQQTRSCTAPSTAYGGTPCSGPSSRPCFSPSTFSPTPPPSSPTPPSAPVVNGNVVTYNGKQYRTRGGGRTRTPGNLVPDNEPARAGGPGQNPLGTAKVCEDNGGVAVPAGWKVADNTADSRAVIAAYDWNTDLIVLSNGYSYVTKNLAASSSVWGSPGSVYVPGMLGESGNNVWTVGCWSAVLLEKDVAPKSCPCPSCPPKNGQGACCHWTQPGPAPASACETQNWTKETCTPAFGTWCE